MGDAIQFARYVPMVAARGARVILVVQDALVSVAVGIAGGRAVHSEIGAPRLPPFDIHCPICSLPLAFGTGSRPFRPTCPICRAPAAAACKAWEERLGPA